MQTNTLQWLQLANNANAANAVTTGFTLKLPANYTNNNTTVFVSFNDINAVALAQSNVANKKFVTENLPINKNIKIIVLSKQIGDYYFAVLNANTSATQQTYEITPTKKSLGFIKDFLVSL